MQELSKIQSRTKLIKYIFLSASICALVAILITLYIQKLPVEDESYYESSDKKTKKLSKGYSLNIKKSVFEGTSEDSSLYTIIVQNISRNESNEHLMTAINGKYTLPSGEITIKADRGILDKQKNLITLNDNVKILFNDMLFNSSYVVIDLGTKDVKSNSEVEVTFKKSKIRADKFKTQDSATTIKFEGNVNSIFDLNGLN